MVVMRFSLLACRYPAYCALRAKSQALALLWQLGHGFFWMALLSLPGGVALWRVSANAREPPRKGAWTVVAVILLFAGIGIVVKRYVIKKGGASIASSD